jgi:peptide/nickel transport system permease protein
MATYIVRRLFQGIVVIIIVTFLVFIVIRALPGDPIEIYLTQQQTASFTQEQIKEAEHKLGLDKPVLVQYFVWVGDLCQGNLGTSLFYHEKVSKLILERLVVTLHMGIIAFIISVILGLLTGIISALRRGKLLDTIVTLFANVGITVPVFWLGIILIYFFSFKIPIFSIYGYTSPFTDFWLNAKQIVLPIVCLAIFPISSTARQTRSAMLEVTTQDYIRTAWSKGLNERYIVLKHMLKNGLIPVFTLIGTSVSYILGGSVIVETVFSIPGMGRLSVEALFSQDYSIIQAIILINAIIVVLVNFLVEITYGWFDPRIRYD